MKGFSSELKFINVAQAWSLTVEESFYFSAPIFFYFKRKDISNITLLFFVYSLALVYWCLGKKIQWHGFFNEIHFMWVYTFFGRAFDFFVGIVCSERLLALSKKSNLPKRTLIGILGLILSMCLLSVVGKIFQNPGEFGVYSWWGVVINNFVAPIFIGFLILGLVTEKSFLSAFLSSRTLNFLGKSSYAFYLIQQGPFQEFFHKFFNNLLLEFLALVFLSGILYLFWEEPLNKLLRPEKNQIRLAFKV